jgi:hypothetical protein
VACHKQALVRVVAWCSSASGVDRGPKVGDGKWDLLVSKGGGVVRVCMHGDGGKRQRHR